MQMLCAYGVREVFYRDVYPESEAPVLAEHYGIRLVCMTDYPQLIEAGVH
jgi:dCMP deaminase